jgi:coenzyme F420 hydrogenase subunit beta
LSFLKRINKEYYPLALVGLSCHIHGLYNLLEHSPSFKNSIKYKIGLICGGIMGYSAMDYFCSKANKVFDKEWTLHYRDKAAGGYPGNIKIADKDNSYTLPKSMRIAVKEYFTPARCRICFDKMNVFSDITVGDPWGIENVVHKKGSSVCIARNPAGLELLEKAVSGKSLILDEISYKSVLKGQKISLKKKEWQGYIRAWLAKNRELPNYCSHFNNQTGKIKITEYIEKLEALEALDALTSKDLLIRHIEQNVHKKQILKRLNFLPPIIKNGICNLLDR